MSQPLQALKQANEVRLARFKLKRDLKAGEVMAAEVLLSEIPDWLERMPVEELVLARHRFQRRNFQRAMHAGHAGLGLTIGELTQRQREIVGAQIAEFELRIRSRSSAAA